MHAYTEYAQPLTVTRQYPVDLCLTDVTLMLNFQPFLGTVIRYCPSWDQKQHIDLLHRGLQCQAYPPTIYYLEPIPYSDDFLPKPSLQLFIPQTESAFFHSLI